jgi:catechol 2,3-dioxygenase-like lactoylglutathione lyase family enzyme
MKTYLEHANLHVENVDRMLEFIHAALPDFNIRFDSGANDPERWVHIGNTDFYLAVYQASAQNHNGKTPYDGRPGINHLGFVVADVGIIRQRLTQAGFIETTIPNDHPARHRIYFNDAEGNDWEFVQYLTEDRKQRNDYLQEMVVGLIDR